MPVKPTPVKEAKNSAILSDHRVPMARWGDGGKFEGIDEESLHGSHPLRGGGRSLSIQEMIERRAEVCAAIRLYLKKHREATWKQIYQEVPNHYASHTNLREAFWRVVERGKRAN